MQTGHILDLDCVRLSSAAPFWKSYAKLYFGAKHLQKGLSREWVKCLGPFFHKKVSSLADIERCPKFLEYALINFSFNKNKVTGIFDPLSANATKWSNTLKQFVGCQPTNCWSVFDQFVALALKLLRSCQTSIMVFLRKQFTVFISLLFTLKASSQMFNAVLNSPQNVLKNCLS